jgi:hypothetical protein
MGSVPTVHSTRVVMLRDPCQLGGCCGFVVGSSPALGTALTAGPRPWLTRVAGACSPKKEKPNCTTFQNR